MHKVIDFFFEKVHLIKKGQGLQCKNIVVFLVFTTEDAERLQCDFLKNQVLDSKI